METVQDILGSLLAIAGSMLLFAVVGFIVLAVTVIANWKLFVKMGEPGWKSIIPLYNTYILFKHVWGNGWMMLTTCIPFIGAIFALIANWKMFAKFGKSGFFCFMGIFFAPICMLICAFDSSTFTE